MLILPVLIQPVPVTRSRRSLSSKKPRRGRGRDWKTGRGQGKSRSANSKVTRRLLLDEAIIEHFQFQLEMSRAVLVSNSDPIRAGCVRPARITVLVQIAYFSLPSFLCLSLISLFFAQSECETAKQYLNHQVKRTVNHSTRFNYWLVRHKVPTRKTTGSPSNGVPWFV